MEEQKLYDVVVSGTLYEDGWSFSITSIIEKDLDEFQEVIDRVAVDCPDYGRSINLMRDIDPGTYRSYFMNTHGGSSTDMYAVQAKTAEEAENLISTLVK